LATTEKQTCSHGTESTSNRGTVGIGVFYAVHAKELHNEDSSQAVVSCKRVCEATTRRFV
jgi:hypothetical protein